MLQWRREAASRSCSAHLAITSHFWFFDKNLALKELFPYSYLLMKHRFLICILITLGGTAAYAQDQATTNAPSLFSPAPAAVPPSNTPAPVDAATSAINAPLPTAVDPLAPAANSGAGSPGQNPPASDPNSLIPPPLEPQQPSPINSAGNEEKQRQDQKAKYYAAKVKADKEETLSALLTKSDKAKSDETKRETLREYYDLLAKRMKKIDPSISDWIDTMHSAYLRRLQQIRVEPSIPSGLPPSVNAASGASASPSPTDVPVQHRKKKKADSNNN
jgi:hypothetical protein